MYDTEDQPLFNIESPYKKARRLLRAEKVHMLSFLDGYPLCWGSDFFTEPPFKMTEEGTAVTCHRCVREMRNGTRI